MRIVEQNSTDSPKPLSQAQSLLKEVLDVATMSIAAGPFKDPVLGELTNACRTFYEDFYVKPDTQGSVIGLPIDSKLSLIESDIINFLLSEQAETMPYLFVEHAGRGKSTILKYLAFYLHERERALQRNVWPIYISLRTHEARIKDLGYSTELHLFFSELIKQKVYSRMKSYLSENTDAILKWLDEEHGSALQGRFPLTTRLRFSADLDEQLRNWAETSQQDFIELVNGCLFHYSQHYRPVSLFLDDADNFSLDCQASLLDFAHNRIENGLRVLVSLRFSTWQALEEMRRDRESHISPRIDWSLDKLKNLLCRRLENAEETVLLQLEYGKGETDKVQLVSAFIDLLKGKQATKFLIETSNYNLHSLMRKIQHMPKSWHFTDSVIMREILMLGAQPVHHGARLSTVLDLSLGWWRGTFRSKNQVAQCGLINCLCTRDEKHQPYTFFVRLHVLTRLIKHRNDANMLPVRELEEEYREIFSNSLRLRDVFNRTLFRLVQGNLIATKSCRRYQTEFEVKEHVLSDSVHITAGGLYYLKFLICYIEYIYFMKDDIDWPDRVDLSEIEQARVGAPRWQRHQQALRALHRLMTLEYEMLEALQERLEEPGDGRLAELYVNKFSSRRITQGRGSVLFTRRILDAYIEYFCWSQPDFRSSLGRELEKFDELQQSYTSVVGGFS